MGRYGKAAELWISTTNLVIEIIRGYGDEKLYDGANVSKI